MHKPPSKTSSDQSVKSQTRRLTGFGIVLTFAMVALGLWLWPADGSAGLQPNEIGDFVGGFAAAIALVWLVLGFYIQSAALRIQSEELRDNTLAQRDQIQALSSQAAATQNTADALRDFLRPFVTAELALEGRQLVVRVANRGGRPAVNVQVEFDPPLSELVESPHDPSNILRPAYLPPGSELREPLTFAPALYMGGRDHVRIDTHVRTVYEDESHATYRHSYTSSIEQRVNNAMKEETIRTSLNRIANGIGSDSSGDLKSVKRSVESILSQLRNVAGREGGG